MSIYSKERGLIRRQLFPDEQKRLKKWCQAEGAQLLESKALGLSSIAIISRVAHLLLPAVKWGQERLLRREFGKASVLHRMLGGRLIIRWVGEVCENTCAPPYLHINLQQGTFQWSAGQEPGLPPRFHQRAHFLRLGFCVAKSPYSSVYSIVLQILFFFEFWCWFL